MDEIGGPQIGCKGRSVRQLCARRRSSVLQALGGLMHNAQTMLEHSGTATRCWRCRAAAPVGAVRRHCGPHCDDPAAQPVLNPICAPIHPVAH